MSVSRPSHLGPIAQQKWTELSALLAPIDPHQTDALALLCVSWEMYLTALKDIQAKGQVHESAINGRLFVNPSIGIMESSWKQIVKLSKAFGLVPDTKQRETEDEDPMSELLGD
jgi:P27 family predicted phage terminase small subunit